MTTSMPLAPDTPFHFGVRDVCSSCNICTNNCPSEAIPLSGEYVVTQGVKRWIVDVSP